MKKLLRDLARISVPKEGSTLVQGSLLIRLAGDRLGEAFILESPNDLVGKNLSNFALITSNEIENEHKILASLQEKSTLLKLKDQAKGTATPKLFVKSVEELEIEM